MKCLLALLIILPNVAHSQTFNSFKWHNAGDITFRTVEMKVTEAVKEAQKPVFDGYKDATVIIKQLSDGNPMSSFIELKLSGYFEFFGIVETFQHKINGEKQQVEYMARSGNKLVNLLLVYMEDKTRPAFIIVTVTPDLLAKQMKILSFTLRGFE